MNREAAGPKKSDTRASFAKSEETSKTDMREESNQSGKPWSDPLASDVMPRGKTAPRRDPLPTYQEALDSAIEDTFPASDPIAVGGATKILEPHTTLRDARDWTLKPGSECDSATGVGSDDDPRGDLAQRDAGGPRLSSPCEAIVRRRLTLQATVADAAEVPVGPCSIQQSEHRAILHWTVDGEGHSGSMPIEEFRDRLADGTLQRSCDEVHGHEPLRS